MTMLKSSSPIQNPEDQLGCDEAQLAAGSFLARYSGRTFDAYRDDLRGFFQWAADHDIGVLRATRPHIALFRAWLEERDLAASTIDRRLSTVCGFYRFAHIDGRISANPAQYVRRPQVHPSDARGLDRSELGVFLFTAEQFDRAHAALAVLLGLNGLRVSRRALPRSRTSGSSAGTGSWASSARATSPPRSRSSPVLHEPSTWPSVNATTARSCAVAIGSASTGAPRTGGCVRSASGPGLATSTHTCSERRSSWLRSTPVSRCATSRSLPATPTHAPQPSTTGDARTSTGTSPTSSPSSQAADRHFEDTRRSRSSALSGVALPRR